MTDFKTEVENLALNPSPRAGDIDAILTLHHKGVREADRISLETISALLNGDSNQVDVTRNYVFNKLKMLAQLSEEEKP